MEQEEAAEGISCFHNSFEFLTNFNFICGSNLLCTQSEREREKFPRMKEHLHPHIFACRWIFFSIVGLVAAAAACGWKIGRKECKSVTEFKTTGKWRGAVIVPSYFWFKCVRALDRCWRFLSFVVVSSWFFLVGSNSKKLDEFLDCVI